jgi:hypothetical protein
MSIHFNLGFRGDEEEGTNMGADGRWKDDERGWVEGAWKRV